MATATKTRPTARTRKATTRPTTRPTRQPEPARYAQGFPIVGSPDLLTVGALVPVRTKAGKDVTVKVLAVADAVAAGIRGAGPGELAAFVERVTSDDA